jgi:bis(5'-nucleosidyl)-tetraphosphatase
MARKEHSFGIIPVRFHLKEWQVLMIKHQGGHWSFPKGHQDPGEMPKETAERELKEEVNLEVTEFLKVEPFEEHYFFTYQKERIEKKVTYFVAFVQGKVVLQQEELLDYQWLFFDEAEALATFEEAKRLCREVKNFLLQSKS